MKNIGIERTETRERILEVSAKLFAEKGYSATGIDEIARNVGITKSVIYYHFKNKEDILQTLIDEAFAQLKQPEINEAHKQFHETGEQFQEIMGLIQFMGTERNRRIIKIIFMESMMDQNESVPLFDIWDQSVALHRGFGGQPVDEWLNNDPRRKVETFFLFVLPLLTFFIFRDRWCDHYKLSPEEAWNALRAGLMDYFYPKLF
ncbi:MAG TPA: TetR/AcrR family transcriptional regulator [Firmicutes bacterium]|nr:TetR/AcrR family transcriptional regulator [Bacillota bacterium]